MASEAGNSQSQSEKIFTDFQSLRNEQRNLVNKLTAIEMDLKEHKTVIETLKAVDEDRKCFRLIGGILCERTVKDVLPQLVENKGFLEKAVVISNEQLTKKGIQINQFKQEHNIRIRGQDPAPVAADNKSSKPAEETDAAAGGIETRNILVTN